MLYDYVCQSSQHEMHDVYQSIRDDPKKKCPQCGKNSLERVLYGGLYGFTKNVNTIGQLAEQNTKNMGHYKRSEIEAKNKEKNQGSDTQKLRREINNMSPSQVKRYIMEGKK